MPEIGDNRRGYRQEKAINTLQEVRLSRKKKENVGSHGSGWAHLPPAPP